MNLADLLLTLTAVGGLVVLVAVIATRLHDASATLSRGLDLLLPMPTNCVECWCDEHEAGRRIVCADCGRLTFEAAAHRCENCLLDGLTEQESNR